MLAQAEAQLTDPEGPAPAPLVSSFPLRPRLLHGLWRQNPTGGAEAIEEEEYEQVAQEVARTAARLEALTAHIEAMNALLRSAALDRRRRVTCYTNKGSLCSSECTG